jgi:hypothetical protein
LIANIKILMQNSINSKIESKKNIKGMRKKAETFYYFGFTFYFVQGEEDQYSILLNNLSKSSESYGNLEI